MVLTAFDRGTGTHNTAGTTLVFLPATSLRPGMAVLVIAADNAGSGGAYSITTCTDTKGNTWTRQRSPLYDPGLASAGISGAIFTTPQNGGLLTTSDTITVQLGATTTAKAWALFEVVNVPGIPQSGLIGYWPLLEASLTRRDAFAGFHLTDVATVTGNTGPNTLYPTASAFAAASLEYLFRADDNAFSMSGAGFTGSAWVRLTSKTVARTLFAKANRTGNQFEYALRYEVASDRFEVLISFNGTQINNIVANALGSPAINTWYHVVFTYDGTTNLWIYVNNGAGDRVDWFWVPPNGTAPFTIGMEGDGTTGPMDGRIAGVALWNRVLSSGERADLYAAGPANTVNYIDGGESAGSATTTPTVTSASASVGDMVVGALYNEYGTAQTVTEDTDVVGGVWSPQQTAEVGTTAAGVTVAAQRVIVTTAGTQTYNPVLATNSDALLSWMQLRATPVLQLISVAGDQIFPTGFILTQLTRFVALTGNQPYDTGSLWDYQQRALVGNQPFATGLLNKNRFITLVGSQPYATGALNVLQPENLVGDQPAATGALSPVKLLAVALAGAQPTANGALQLSSSIAISGAQPYATATLAARTTVVALTGAQQAPSGAVTALYYRALVGNQPAGSGLVGVVSALQISLVGNQPYASSTLAVYAQIALSGNQPYATGTVVRLRMIATFTGSQPYATGTLLVFQYRTLVGDQPFATGVLTVVAVRLASLSGDQLAASGTLNAQAVLGRVSDGTQPYATGTLAVTYLIALVGSQPAASGTLNVGRAQTLAGDQPFATGTLTATKLLLVALAGSQPYGTGTIAAQAGSAVDVAGDQPADAGVLTGRATGRAYFGDQPYATGTLLVFQSKTLVGTQPYPTGALLTFARIALASSQPASTGVLTVRVVFLRPVVGDQPAATGSLTAQAFRSVALTGSQPAATGQLDAEARVPLFIALLGNQQSPTGVLVAFAMLYLDGSQPYATGLLTQESTVPDAILLDGAQPYATGELEADTPPALGNGIPLRGIDSDVSEVGTVTLNTPMRGIHSRVLEGGAPGAVVMTGTRSQGG